MFSTPRARLLISAAAALMLASAAPSPALASSGDPQAQEFYQRAEMEFLQGRVREASIELRNALQRDPDFQEARFLFGKILFGQGDIRGAEKELRRARRLGGGDEVEAFLGEALMRLGRFEDALEAVSEEGADKEGRIRKSLIRGNALAALERYDEAEAQYRAVNALDAQIVEAHYGLARIQALRGDNAQALATLEAVIEGQPDYAPAWLLRGETLLSMGEKYAALAAFNQAMEITPDSLHIYVARARAHLAAGDAEAARRDAMRAAEIAPTNPIGHYLTAAIAYSTGDLDRANADYTSVRRVFADFPPAIMLGALIKFSRGELQQAERMLNQYTQMRPDDRSALRALANIRIRNSQPQSALVLLRRLLESDPNDVDALRLEAAAHLTTDDFDAAERAYERIAALGAPVEARRAKGALALMRGEEGVLPEGFAQDDGAGRDLLKAMSRLNNNDIEGAGELTSAMLAGAPDNPIYLNLAAGVEIARQDFKAARAHLEKAVEIQPEFIGALNNLDRIDAAQGRAEEIEPRLRALAERNPQSAALAVRLARRLLEEGRVREALEFLQTRAADTPEAAPIAQMRVRAYFLIDARDKAADEAARLARIAPKDDVAALTFAATALRDAGDAKRAASVAQMLVKAAPDSPRARVLLAEALAADGDERAARKTLGEARDQWPANRSIARALTDLAVAKKDLQGALAAAARIKPHDALAALRLQSGALIRLGEPERAIELLERALPGQPETELAIDLFTARRRAGRDDAAIEGLAQWVADHPRDRRALTALGSALMGLERYEEAGPVYRALLSEDPNNPIALNNYAWLRHGQGHPDALDYAERAYRVASGSPEIADTYGWLMVQRGRMKDGLEVLRAAAGAAPDNADILYHLAYALSETGRESDARIVLSRAMAQKGPFAERAQAQELMKRLQ